MKRTTLIGAIILIGIVTYAIEYYANSQFDSEDIQVTGLDVDLDVLHQFRYLKSQEPVGTFKYTVSEVDGVYVMSSETDVTDGETRIRLEAEYKLTESLEPLEYTLVVLNEDQRTDISTEVTQDEIITYVTFEGVTLNITDDYVDGVLFVENNMPGFWEIILNSIALEGGTRYSGNIYIPQGAVVFPINLVVSRNPQNIRIDGVQLSCKVIKEADLDLAFYIYEGELVQMRNDNQDLVFLKNR